MRSIFDPQSHRQSAETVCGGKWGSTPSSFTFLFLFIFHNPAPGFVSGRLNPHLHLGTHPRASDQSTCLSVEGSKRFLALIELIISKFLKIYADFFWNHHFAEWIFLTKSHTKIFEKSSYFWTDIFLFFVLVYYRCHYSFRPLLLLHSFFLKF